MRPSPTTVEHIAPKTTNLSDSRMTRQRHRGKDIHGILLFDKPTGLTSNRALQIAKRIYQAAKAGHTGSLDPLATGMLPICFGAATRVSSFLLDANKSYCVTAQLGVATDSGDSEGQITTTAAVPPLDEAAVRSALACYLGNTEQVPPMHSALKHKGKRLYELARAGVEVAREARPVRIDAIELEALDASALRFTVTCSKGTYVRTLVEDIAKDLGTLAHVTALRRTKVEPFDPDGMISLETLEETEAEGPAALQALLKPVDSPLQQMPRIDLQEDACARLCQGQAVSAEAGWPLARVRLYDPECAFFGIGEIDASGHLVPRRIFPGLSSWN